MTEKIENKTEQLSYNEVVNLLKLAQQKMISLRNGQRLHKEQRV